MSLTVQDIINQYKIYIIMKKSILNLGKALSKSQLTKINGGCAGRPSRPSDRYDDRVCTCVIRTWICLD